MSESSELRNWLLLIFLSVIWGTSFILIKRSLYAFNAVEVATLRVGISGLAFSPFFLSFIRQLEWKRWWFYLIISLTGTGVPAILYAQAQTQLSSATSGILNSITPIFALIIGIVFFKNPKSSVQALGVLLGFVGGAALIYLDKPVGEDLSFPLGYALLIVIGTVMYGTNVNLVKEFFQHVRPMHLSAFSFVLLGIPVMCIVPFTSIPDTVINHPQGVESLLAVSLLAVMSTVFALILFYKIVQDTSAVFAATVAYIIPIVAILWGFFDNEFVGWPHFVSIGLILIGVFLIRKGGKRLS